MDIDDSYTFKICSEICSTLHPKLPDSAKAAETRFQERKHSIDKERINYCLKQFLQAEFDWKSPGDRGLGRLSEAIPRLAAHFRKTFSKLSNEQLNLLDEVITNLIIKAYLYQMLLSALEIELRVKTKDDMYKEWIPRIYSSEADILSKYCEVPHLLKVIEFVFYGDIEKIKEAFKECKLKAGFFSSSKTIDSILYGYLNAGFLLRLIDANKA